MNKKGDRIKISPVIEYPIIFTLVWNHEKGKKKIKNSKFLILLIILYIINFIYKISISWFANKMSL